MDQHQSAKQPSRPLKYKYGEDQYGELHSVGMPPEAHRVENLIDLEEDLDVQLRVSSTLRRMGAPPSATDHMYGWEGAHGDEDNWLWISYRPRYRRPTRTL